MIEVINMVCRCTNNKIVNKIHDDTNNKTLNIEDMKNIPIDDIVKLYQAGYKIETMQYGTYCSGTTTVDRQNTNAPSDLNVHLYEAFAQKVRPTNKCLANVVLRMAKDGTFPNDMYVEIREHDTSTGLPKGDPQTSGNLGSYRIPQASIPNYPSFSDITIPLNILLSDTHMANGVWIVACIYNYDPNIIDPYPYAYMKNGVSGTPTEFMAFKSGTLPWQGNPSWNLYFKTNKQTYSAPPTLTTITISPTSATVNIGSIQAFTATCKDQNNNNMTCPTLSWTSSNTSVGTVSPTEGTSTTFTAITSGTTNITASAEGVNSNASPVTVPAPTLNTITLSPASITLSPGGIQTFTATCKDQNNNNMTCPTITWSVDPPILGTVSPTTGTSTAFTAGMTAGTTTIRATSGTKSGTATITISTTTPTLNSIQVSPSTTSIAPNATQQFSATCKDQFNNNMTCPTITWSVDPPILGTVSPTTGTSTTFTAGTTTGTTTVRATSGTKSGTAAMTVTTTPSAGAGAGMAIVIVAALAVGYLVLRPKPPIT